MYNIVLLGVQDQRKIRWLKDDLEELLDYKTITNATADQVIETVANDHDRQIKGIIAEVNLGYPGMPNISAGTRIFNYLQTHYNNASEIFLGLTAHAETYNKAIEAGIPTELVNANRPIDLETFIQNSYPKKKELKIDWLNRPNAQRRGVFPHHPVQP